MPEPVSHNLAWHTAVARAVSAAPIAAAALAGAAVLLRAPLNHDVAWHLIASRRVLGGERLYIDILETNPPLIVWLSAIPARLADATGISDQRAVALCAGLVLAACTGLAAGLLGRTAGVSARLRSLVVGSLLIAGSVVFAASIGQREHLAFLLMLPYLVAAARQPDQPMSRALLVAVGLLAGVGTAIKPDFVLPIVGVEALVAVRRGSLAALRRPEVIALAATQGICLVALLAVTPQYVFEFLPWMWGLYSSYDVDRRVLLQRHDVWVMAFGLGTAVCVGLSERGTAAAGLCGAAGGAGLGFLAAYWLQAKGFGYHLRPIQGLALVSSVLLIWWAARVVLRRPPDRRWSWRTRGVAAIIGLIGLGLLTVTGRAASRQAAGLLRPQPSVPPALVALVKAEASGQPIFVLSTSIWPAFPLVNVTAATWPYRYPFLWPLPAFYGRRSTGQAGGYRRPEEQGPLERTFVGAVVDDLAAHPPRLLIVDRSPRKQALEGRAFDYVEYFSLSPRFASLFSRYRRVGAVGPFDVYAQTR